MNQTIRKLERLCDVLYERMFHPVGTTRVLGLYETRTPLHSPPDETLFSAPGSRWGGEGVYGWFHLEFPGILLTVASNDPRKFKGRWKSQIVPIHPYIFPLIFSTTFISINSSI
ncbi:MAG: hypothetical protein J6I53_13450 [Treponema sp.]|nr:hypothetical protein [Treponema sp.]